MSASIIPCAPKQLFQLSFVSCILKGCETRCFPTTTPVVALRAWRAPTLACPNPERKLGLEVAWVTWNRERRRRL